jgi:hypothetical protein
VLLQQLQQQLLRLLRLLLNANTTAALKVAVYFAIYIYNLGECAHMRFWWRRSGSPRLSARGSIFTPQRASEAPEM